MYACWKIREKQNRKCVEKQDVKRQRWCWAADKGVAEWGETTTTRMTEQGNKCWTPTLRSCDGLLPVELQHSPFTQLLQHVKHFLWLLGETVLTQLLQLSGRTQKVGQVLTFQKKWDNWSTDMTAPQKETCPDVNWTHIESIWKSNQFQISSLVQSLMRLPWSLDQTFTWGHLQVLLLCGPFCLQLCLQTEKLLCWVEISWLTWTWKNVPFVCLQKFWHVLVASCLGSLSIFTVKHQAKCEQRVWKWFSCSYHQFQPYITPPPCLTPDVYLDTFQRHL